VRDGSRFDVWTSGVVIAGYAIPGFLFAIFLIIVFAGGRYFDLFPLRGLVSDGWSEMGTLRKIADYFWHITLPVLSMVISGFAGLTILTKNSFLEEINKTMKIVRYSSGRFYLDVENLIERERPPMIELPEYCAKIRQQMSENPQ